MYNTLDQHNIVEHLAVTKQRWAGSKVSEELVAKYGRHTRYSYQSYLRDNLEKGALLRLRAEEYMRTGENPIKITPRLRMVGGSGHHVGDSHFNAPPSRQTMATRDHNGQDGGGFEEDMEGDEEEDPILNSSGEPSGRTHRPEGDMRSDPSASNGRMNHLGTFAPRGNLRGYRPHGTITHLDEEMQRRREEAEQELQAEEAARLAEVREREESRPADASEDETAETQVQARNEEGSEDQAEQEDIRAAHEAEESRFSPSDKHLLAMMVMNVLKRAINEGVLSEDDIDAEEDDAAFEYLESRTTMGKGQRLWHTIAAKHTHHSADEWADHYWKWIGRYMEAAKLIMMEGLEDVATQQLQATQDPEGGDVGDQIEAEIEDEDPAALQEQQATLASNGIRIGEQQHEGDEEVTASATQVPQGTQALLQEALNDYLEEEELDELERSRLETDAGEVSALVESEIQPVAPPAQIEGLEPADEYVEDGPVEIDGGHDQSESQLLQTADEDQRARHHEAKVNMRVQASDRHAGEEELFADNDERPSPTEEALTRAELQISRESAQQIRTPSGTKRRRDDSEENVGPSRQRRISSNAAIRAAESAVTAMTTAPSETSAVTPARADRSHASSSASGIPTVGSHAKIKYLDLSKDEVNFEQEEGESDEDASDVSQSQIVLPNVSRVAQGKRRQTEERPRGILRAQESTSRRIHSTPLVEQPSRRAVEVYEDAPTTGRLSSSRQARRPSSREYASTSADDSRLSLSRSSASRSRTGALEKEEAKLALQRRCLRLAKKYGFSSMRQVTPFVSAAGLDTVRGEELILRRFDALAEEYGVQRDIVIEYVREADGSVEQAEKFLRLAEMSRSRVSMSGSAGGAADRGRGARQTSGGGNRGRRRAEQEVEEEASFSEEDDRNAVGEDEQMEVEEQPPTKRRRRRF